MSFSFGARGSSKEAVESEIDSKMADVVAQQPIHAADEAAVRAVAKLYLDILAPAEDGDEIIISVSGSLSWHGDQSNNEFTRANVAVSASLQKKVI